MAIARYRNIRPMVRCATLLATGWLCLPTAMAADATPTATPSGAPAGAATTSGTAPAANDAAAAGIDNASSTTRYGFLNLLDHRSRYGQDFFPEPFRMDEADVDNELRGDYLYTTGHGQRTNLFHGEVEKSFGLLTIEVEAAYERDSDREFDPATGGSPYSRVEGVDNIDLGARVPIYQYVSSNGFFDNSLGVAFEVGIPSGSALGKNTEIVPKLFDAVRLGEHFTFQTIVGWSSLLGPDPDGGSQHFEYGALLGYNITREQLPLPGVHTLVPLFELIGEHGINMDDAGKDVLSATIGPRIIFKPVGGLEPKFGIGYIVPLDKGARDEFNWGIITSLVFEY